MVLAGTDDISSGNEVLREGAPGDLGELFSGRRVASAGCGTPRGTARDEANNLFR